MMTKEERQWVTTLEDKVGALDIRMMELERSNRSLWQVYNEHDDRLDDIERIVRKLAKAEIKRKNFRLKDKIVYSDEVPSGEIWFVDLKSINKIKNCG